MVIRIHIGGFSENVSQIFVRIQAVFLGSFNYAEHNRAAGRAPGCIHEKEVLPVNHKRLDAALGAII